VVGRLFDGSSPSGAPVARVTDPRWRRHGIRMDVGRAAAERQADEPRYLKAVQRRLHRLFGAFQPGRAKAL
jgi:hypothetical protein